MAKTTSRRTPPKKRLGRLADEVRGKVQAGRAYLWLFGCGTVEAARACARQAGLPEGDDPPDAAWNLPPLMTPEEAARIQREQQDREERWALEEQIRLAGGLPYDEEDQ